MIAKSFTNLVVWQKAHTLAIHTYQVVHKFPKEELYGLTSQIKRAVVSVSSNIAEGFARQSNKEKINFYFIALGSLTEIQSQLLLAQDLLFITHEQCSALIDEATVVGKMLNSLISKIKSNNI